MTDIFLRDQNGEKQKYSGIKSVSFDGNDDQKETFLQPELQEKTISIRQNGTVTVPPDEGFDGISAVKVKTSVPPTMQEYRFLTPSRPPQKSDWAEGAASYPLFYSSANDTGGVLNGLMGAVGFADGQPPVVNIINLGGSVLTGIPADAHFFFSWQELNAAQLADYRFGAISYTFADTAVLPVGWSYPVAAETGEISSFILIDTSAAKLQIGSDAYDSEQFNDYFYELFTLADIEDKAVSVTQNGTTTIRADHAALGIHQVDLTVDIAAEEKTVALSMADGDQEVTPADGEFLSKVTVEKPSALTAENIKAGVNIGGVEGTYLGSGGSGVQPDWAQNDATAADHIKNRPGGYYGAELAAVAIRFDGDTTGKSTVNINGTPYVKISDETVTCKEQLVGGTATAIVSGTERTVTVDADTVAAEVNEYPTLIDFGSLIFFVKEDFTEQIDAETSITLTKGTWAMHVEGSIQILSITIPAYRPIYRFSRDFIPYATPNWEQNDPDAESYIKNRPGGYYFNNGLPSQTFEYDGNKEGKTTNSNRILIDSTVGTKSGALLYQQFIGAAITINSNGELSTGKLHMSSFYGSSVFFESDGTFSQSILWDADGIWFKDTRDADGNGTYVTKLVLNSSGNFAQLPEAYLTDEVVKVKNTWDSSRLTEQQKRFTSDSIGAVSFYGGYTHTSEQQKTARNSIEAPSGMGKALCTIPTDGYYTTEERQTLRNYLFVPEGDRNSVILYSPTNKKFKITVDHDGNIAATEVTE